MRYLRYCDTRANFWRRDAICERKSTIPNAIPCDTECDTISVAGRTRKKYKSRTDAICWVTRAAKKYDTNQNTLKKYDTACLKKNAIPCDTTIPTCSAKVRYQ